MKFLVSLNEKLSEFAILRSSLINCCSLLRWGVVFDLVECLIQRDLGYTTKDVRAAYDNIKDALVSTNPKLQKVVVIAHSQGGIILSMALDNLLSDLPRER